MFNPNRGLICIFSVPNALTLWLANALALSSQGRGQPHKLFVFSSNLEKLEQAGSCPPEIFGKCRSPAARAERRRSWSFKSRLSCTSKRNYDDFFKGISARLSLFTSRSKYGIYHYQAEVMPRMIFHGFSWNEDAVYNLYNGSSIKIYVSWLKQILLRQVLRWSVREMRES